MTGKPFFLRIQMTKISFQDICSKLSSNDSFESRFCHFMRLVGIEKVNVCYSGGGDSGAVESIEVVAPTMDEEIKKKLEVELMNKEDDLGHWVWERHGSFADGGGYWVSGRVVYSVGMDQKEDRVWIEGSDYETEYGDYNEETDEYENEVENESSFEDSCWQRDEGEVYDGQRIGSMFGSAERKPDLGLLISYAKLSYKEIPEEIHNMILTAASMGDEEAKDYIKNKD